MYFHYILMLICHCNIQKSIVTLNRYLWIMMFSNLIMLWILVVYNNFIISCFWKLGTPPDKKEYVYANFSHKWSIFNQKAWNCSCLWKHIVLFHCKFTCPIDCFNLIQYLFPKTPWLLFFAKYKMWELKLSSTRMHFCWQN